MKIEKINDRQIRCTLTKEDLASREIKLSELAYGSDKAKALFQDMMQQAAEDFGFEAENMPLVVEAIPVSMETIVLIITKVDDPEELDTRFARFSPETDAPASDATFPDLKDKIEGADDVLGLIRRISEAKKHAAHENSSALLQRKPHKNSLQLRNSSMMKSCRSSPVFIFSAHWMTRSTYPLYSALSTMVRMPCTKIRRTAATT